MKKLRIPLLLLPISPFLFSLIFNWPEIHGNFHVNLIVSIFFVLSLLFQASYFGYSLKYLKIMSVSFFIVVILTFSAIMLRSFNSPFKMIVLTVPVSFFIAPFTPIAVLLDQYFNHKFVIILIIIMVYLLMLLSHRLGKKIRVGSNVPNTIS